MQNALTIDLEDYYHVTAFADGSGSAGWDSRPSRIEHNTAKLLGLLALTNCRGTFFCLGWIAEKYPSLIREIASAGHEIACHSNRHRFVYSMTPLEFREDTIRAKELLEEASKTQVRGYRAPSFSITADSQWAFEILASLGFTYDSSIFPVKHIDYGMPKAPRFAFRLATSFGPLVEFPMSTLALGSLRCPIAGGAYFRFLPYWFTRWGIGYINRKETNSVCVYLHPWELDPEQPRMQGGPTARARHYLGLRGTETKLMRLLNEIEFCPLGALIQGLNPPAVDPGFGFAINRDHAASMK
jgi:polysaccharide deacetylase family protein (PEP-CTERM system associated)